MTDPRLVHLGEERDRAIADIRELELQVEAGELNPIRAEVLRARYEAAAAEAMRSIDAFEPSEPTTGANRRMILGLGGFLIAATVVTASVIIAVEPRPQGGFATGGVVQDAVGDTPTDLSSISNEEMEDVVAANPDILPMRLALARRYVEQGQFSDALGHYMYVLERETDPEALMYVGWMTYLSGDAATGVELLRQSLQLRPDAILAEWFLANALFHGIGDPAAAQPHLEAVIASGAAPAEIVQLAEEMLAEASP